ncbi:tripartite tricarboxylate transporter permease [Arcobacter sp. F2176]|uniref:tripartite tricarboxylate transporter permease n=1 Tax=Arcobacter sp. F2176 TaxID=2044511 RepID=UPI00100BE91A|nr:tripartite tricarboxylate transporter permease [Arcobacter sp. F2176]RXJ80908.1 C4-dicarboxylate ABC transporter permease [Arcobacter sp. F2176]
MDILNHIIAAIPLVFTVEVFIAMIVGTTIGIAVGALPGLSATMGIAVLIPITFTMHPLTALGMIAGIYNGAMYGGSIPAILLRIPGTPAGVATVFDGYPMAQQGRGPLALNISLASSAIGSGFSAIALLLLAPPLASIAINFGPADYFWLALFGLTTISVLMSNNPVKGLLSACFGLVVGMVGIDFTTGDQRFVFDTTELLGGVNIIIILTGLYAIPPAIELAIKSSSADANGLKLEQKKENFRWLSLTMVWLKSSAIGIVIGIIPALGGNVAALLAWNEQRRSDKDKSKYMNGAPEGVAAAECANNADTAATLIPAITLGIPGNAVAAVILGALLVHGLRPGPDLFTENGDIVYGFMLTMFITAILMFVIGRIGAKAYIHVLKLPSALLAPMILSLTLIGVYAVHNSMFEVGLMLCFGLIGFIMEKLSIPTAPAVLAVILGPMAEESLRRAMLISRDSVGYLFQSYISWIIIAMIAVTLITPILKYFRNRSKKTIINEE